MAKRRILGKVCSFEFHKQRVEKIREEIRDHGLEGIVQVTHRDVYNEGFLLGDPISGESPKANAVFLDLPAPWLAVKHILRQTSEGVESPLDPSSPVHICTFSPCLEQAQQTIGTLRQHSWQSISMVEVSHRNIEVRRERYGVEAEGARGSLPGPRNVEEAVTRLRMIEDRGKALQGALNNARRASQGEEHDDVEMKNCQLVPEPEKAGLVGNSLALSNHGSTIISSSQTQVPAFKQGRLIHRSELELKTHTSYLVFAVLPRLWSEEDEQQCRQRWPSCGKSNATNGAIGAGSKSKKKMKETKTEQARLKTEYKEEKMESEAKIPYQVE
jgi:tRNA (adenine57-N1/adenine58-N1)-methyltransferase